MNFEELTEFSIAQVVSLTMTDQLVNVNKTFVEGLINRAYHTIERRALWKFSEADADITATANTRVCADTPSDLGVPLMVYSPRLGRALDYHDERQKFYHHDAKGQVEAYGLWEGDLKFFPLPSKGETFTLRYYKEWVDLSAPTDTPIFPDTWHDLLTDYAAGNLALRLPPTGDRFLPASKAEPYLQSFQIRLEEMANSDLVMKTWDKVPNYGFIDDVLEIQEW